MSAKRSVNNKNKPKTAISHLELDNKIGRIILNGKPESTVSQDKF